MVDNGVSLDALEAQYNGPAPTGGNSIWAARYGEFVRQVVAEHSRRAERSQQVHLGPSELGVECDRQVVAKLTRVPSVNSMGDSWPSVRGTALHSWLEGAFDAYNDRNDVNRFLTETKVTPFEVQGEAHTGTGDLYDELEQAVVDHKCLAATSLGKIRRNGPPRKYKAQLCLYAAGFEAEGKTVKRVALIAYPATESSLDGLYVWEMPYDDEARALVQEVKEATERRKTMASLVQAGLATLDQIPATPDPDECTWCPIYRPHAVPRSDGSYPGCQGAKKFRGSA